MRGKQGNLPDIMEAGKQSVLSRLIAKRTAADGIKRLDFEWRGTPPRAGQFFLVRPERASVFLGRPLSVAGYGGDTLYFI
ncbi:MAG: hypothetical protein LBH18_07600, partial [Spirochaetaceae bacterium]|nr:hypothetical protein [Spirochaetaceae bacterium]